MFTFTYCKNNFALRKQADCYNACKTFYRPLLCFDAKLYQQRIRALEGLARHFYRSPVARNFYVCINFFAIFKHTYAFTVLHGNIYMYMFMYIAKILPSRRVR